jgi:hypothetical protein
MLATQLLVSADPLLCELRPDQIEARYDLLSGGPQILPRPRSRTPGCFCSDSVYQAVYREKFPDNEGSEEK